MLKILWKQVSKVTKFLNVHDDIGDAISWMISCQEKSGLHKIALHDLQHTPPPDGLTPDSLPSCAKSVRVYATS